MEKRYQVFVSSTFRDLVEERRAVMQALLELDCIPAGMELFPASSDDQWTLIKRVIDDCDYYLVIVAGRYGSVDAEGIGYTEKEYDYAVQQGKPVIGFLHKEPGRIPWDSSERDPDLAKKLAAFRSKVQTRMCKFWSNADELGAVVSRSTVQLRKTHPAEGWVKARFARTAEELEQSNKQYQHIRVLETELDRLRQLEHLRAPDLANHNDPVSLEYVAAVKQSRTIMTTWQDVFAVVGQACINLPKEGDVDDVLCRWIQVATSEERAIKLATGTLEKIKLQFYTLGLIRIERMLHSMTTLQGGISSTHVPQNQSHAFRTWVLTEQGRVELGRQVAEKRSERA